MSVNLNNEQNLEPLLENLIRIQAKLIEKVDSLNRRLSQMESNALANQINPLKKNHAVCPRD